MKDVARCIAVFGTASDVGKSTITSALGRVFSDLGLDVAPFKAQNMSNNSGVTKEGGEMGRAQLVQAFACRSEPHVDMNPVLLKPTQDNLSQIVLLGQPLGQTDAQSYFENTGPLREASLAALARLRQRHEVVLIEGAGSCAEVNLRAREFVNFPIAHAADADVLLIADIDRGGVFAQVVGTLAVMPPEDRARVKAVLINRFRGDKRLFDDGREYLERTTALPVLGVLPYHYGLSIESEDGLALDARIDPPAWVDAEAEVRVAILRLPHISNFTDFDALGRVSDLALHYLYRPRDLAGYDLLVVPGSKAVRQDLAWLRASGWPERIDHFRHSGGRIIGICGGYQMLGRTLVDPHGVEGPAGSSEGLGLLNVHTVFRQHKVLKRTSGQCELLSSAVEGYEIHMGVSESSEQRPLLTEVRRLPVVHAGAEAGEGAVSSDGRVLGTYLHGLFDSPAAVGGLVAWMGKGSSRCVEVKAACDAREDAMNALAEHFREHVDLARLLEIFGPLA